VNLCRSEAKLQTIGQTQLVRWLTMLNGPDSFRSMQMITRHHGTHHHGPMGRGVACLPG
jgi:hypothetical protein